MRGRPRKFDHDEARRRHKAGETAAALAREFGVSHTAVLRAVNPKIRKRLDSYSLEYNRDHRTPCLGGCGRLVWTYATPEASGYCPQCSGALRRTAPHGTETRYTGPDKCRCEPCRLAATAAKKARRNRHKVPCTNCGQPRLPHSENGGDRRGTRDTGLCRPCWYKLRKAERSQGGRVS
jgi:hypothetical protein